MFLLNVNDRIFSSYPFLRYTQSKWRLPSPLVMSLPECVSFYLLPQLNLLFFSRSLMPVSRKNQITFEKTPKYFSLKVVPERIKEFYKEANASVKFVLSLCDPVSRAYSDYIHSVVSKKMYNMSASIFSMLFRTQLNCVV